MKDGAIPARMKRLIAIASAVAVGCDFCVDHHVKLAYQEGISRKEIVEVILVASLVRFGSGVRYVLGESDENTGVR
nr:carboxymuconolactone decarboxylase family protein [Archaeoglobus neptunius]